MSANSFGERFRILSFGESHGPGLGVVIDGCPAGIAIDLELLQRELGRRRPGQSTLTTARQEQDAVEIISGVFEGKTLGTPIAMLVRNLDARSQDYAQVAREPRAGHADDVWKAKFGHVDPRGGGRSSGRETVSRVMAGSIAQMLLRTTTPRLKVTAYTLQVGTLKMEEGERQNASEEKIDSFPARFPSAKATIAEQMILAAREKGDSLGGVAEIRVQGVPTGWGQPVFHKLKADLAAALMSVGASSGIELGSGFEVSNAPGTAFHADAASENYGGIRGGISSGEDIWLRVHFKPTSSILDVAKKGRHDPFIVTRAIPVLESMVWLVLADHALWARSDRISEGTQQGGHS